MRQVDHRPGARGLPARHLGPGDLRRPGRRGNPPRPAPLTAPRDPDDLPGSLLGAQPPPYRRHDHRRPVPLPGDHATGRDPRHRGGPAQPGRPQPRALQPLPQGVLRWPAAAHLRGPRHRLAAPADHRRRAGVRPGRVHPGADHQPAQRPAGHPRPGLPVHRARPVRGPAHLRPGRGDVPRQARGAGRQRAALRRAPAPLHQGAAVRGAGAQHQRPGGSGSACPASRPAR